MTFNRAAVVAACELVADEVAATPKYRHTASLMVRVGSEDIYSRHFSGPELADVFSVTKTVLATVVGVAQRDRLIPPLDQPVSHVLPQLKGTPAEPHTWRHLLTMTRGSETGGAWDIDAVTALPGGQVAHIAAAPQLAAPGTRFRYDNGAAHLLSAALAAVVAAPVALYARDMLFAPLSITRFEWLADPDGLNFGYAHLRLRAADLLSLGSLWLSGGIWHDQVLVDPRYTAAMTTAQTAGGEPEGLPYGYLTWIDGSRILAAGWAGQHVLVVPACDAVIVTTGDPKFTFGPPPADELPADWAPALELVRQHLIPALAATSALPQSEHPGVGS
ncbi:MAG TPA: serine hydrolase domain-containing protein [Propionibacteriaceae bacterium]|nr:serine hydrolase domain-containing protein [Propionibacteriaceae bacterium]